VETLVGVWKFIARTFNSEMAMRAIVCEEEVREECVGKIMSFDKTVLRNNVFPNWRIKGCKEG